LELTVSPPYTPLAADEVVMSALFERFAYHKKENLTWDVENVKNRGDTPNKAHLLPAVTRVMETPGSLLPSPTSETDERFRKNQKRKRRRRRARIASSSEDEGAEMLTPAKALFSDLPRVKRRKSTAEAEPSSRTLTLDLQSNLPRRLFKGATVVEKTPSPVQEHQRISSCAKPVKGKGSLLKKQPYILCMWYLFLILVIVVSSGSEEEGRSHAGTRKGW
jgi:hypothetical protein